MGNAAWRNHGSDFQWTDKFSDDLLEKVAKIKPAGVNYKPVIMLFGPTGHGKSAFINSISSISRGRKSNIASAARASTCVTSVFRKYDIKGKLDNVKLADIQGIVQKDGNTSLIENALAIVDGQVEPEYTFDNTRAIAEEDKIPVSDSNKVHCVIILLDCREVKELNKNFASSITKYMSELYKKDVPRIAVLTHADMADESVGEDITTLYSSDKIKSKVEYVREYLGIPLENIHVVQNFDETSESSENLNKLLNIPLLFALQQALFFAVDTIEKTKS